MTNRLLVYLVFALFLLSCDRGSHMPELSPQEESGEDQSTTETAGAQQTQTVTGPTFQEDIRPLFGKYCSSCHKSGSGIPNWTNYNEAHGKRDQIFQRTIVQKTMPPPGSPQLTEAELAKFKEWIGNDAPEKKTVVTEGPRQEEQGTPSDETVISASSIPGKTVQRVSYPELKCQTIQKYSDGKIKSNRILVHSVVDDIKNVNVRYVDLEFDIAERLVWAENLVLFEAAGDGAKICGVAINNLYDCEVSFNLESQKKLQVYCHFEIPVKFELSSRAGSTFVSCSSSHVVFSSQFKSCRVNQQ